MSLVKYSFHFLVSIAASNVALKHCGCLAGNKISTQTGIGTSIAIAGVALYSYIKAKMEEEKRVSSIYSSLLAFASFSSLKQAFFCGQRTKVA